MPSTHPVLLLSSGMWSLRPIIAPPFIARHSLMRAQAGITVFGTIIRSNNGMSRPSTRFVPVTTSSSLPAIPKACVLRCKAPLKSCASPPKATSSCNRPLPVRVISQRRNGATSAPTGSSPTCSPITSTSLTRVLVRHPFYRRLVFLSLRLQIFSPSSTFPLPPLNQRLQRKRQRVQL